jgi:hypothetical protein
LAANAFGFAAPFAGVAAVFYIAIRFLQLLVVGFVPILRTRNSGTRGWLRKKYGG